MQVYTLEFIFRKNIFCINFLFSFIHIRIYFSTQIYIKKNKKKKNSIDARTNIHKMYGERARVCVFVCDFVYKRYVHKKFVCVCTTRVDVR